jgi:hypothetical protein
LLVKIILRGIKLRKKIAALQVIFPAAFTETGMTGWLSDFAGI